MKWIVPVMSFVGGSMFGVTVMCLMFISHEESERERRLEVRRNAGGSGEQDCEPGD